MTMFGLLRLHLLCFFSSAKLLLLECVDIVFTALLKSLFFLKFGDSFLIERNVERIIDCRLMRFGQRRKKELLIMVLPKLTLMVVEEEVVAIVVTIAAEDVFDV